ncbi:glucokinase [Pseudoxanthomonas sp. KAs_5_3]|uniref:glucokinase n=1 Tax=Pseudoxanthomonas sp. KAs_5_3 TaxID=2067658 RepID=UPI001E5D8C5B|nr:glucokinase [Pseudoxanthomonas sp. KAs_5_3]
MRSDLRACLVADVGGTNARLGWTEDGHAIRDVVVYRCGEHASLAHILDAYLSRVAGDAARRADWDAVVAIAGYLHGDRLVNANLPWEVSVARTANAARLASLVLINDFGAVAHALPGIQRRALVPLLPGQRDDGMRAPALVLGPGTGLGAAMCLDRQGSEVLLTESGHASLAANTPLELEVLRHLAARWRHVDNERVLSGTGMMNLYDILTCMRGETPRHQRSEHIVDAALAGDEVARETLDVFGGWLGSLVADLALTLGAREVYLAGGVTTHIASFLHGGPFQQRYADRFTTHRLPPPIWRIDHGQLGLAGAAMYWRTHPDTRPGHLPEEYA